MTGTASELNDLLAAGELDVSVVSAVEYARNAAALPPAARPRHHLRRPGAQRGALLQAAGRRARRRARCCAPRRRAPRCCCSSCSAATAGACARSFATGARRGGRPRRARAAAPRGGARHRRRGAAARGAQARYPVRASTWARSGRSGPGCRSSSRSGRRGARRRPARCAAVHRRLLESRAWGLAAPRPARRGRRRRAPAWPSAVCRAYLGDLDYALSLPAPGRAHRLLPPAGAGRPGAGRLARRSSRRPERMSLIDDCRSQHVDANSSDYLELYQRAPLLELGRAGRRRAVAAASRAGGHLHHRPQHQLHQRLRRRLRVLRVLPPARSTARATCSASRRSAPRSTSARRIGGVQILLQGGHNPYIPFEWYLELMRYIKRNHPIHIHGFSPERGRLLQRALPACRCARGHPRAAARPGSTDSRRRRRDPGATRCASGSRRRRRRPRSGSGCRRRRTGRG